MSIRTKYDLNDYYMTYYGDIFFEDDDIKDTFTFSDERELTGLSLKQEVITRIEAYKDDWKRYPDIGANLKDYMGTIADIEYVKARAKKAIINCLTSDDFLTAGDLDIKVHRTGPESLVFIVLVKMKGGTTRVSFNYDMTQTNFRHIYWG